MSTTQLLQVKKPRKTGREHKGKCYRHQKLLRQARKYTEDRLYRLARLLPSQKLVAAIACVMHERGLVDDWTDSHGLVRVQKGLKTIQLWPKT